MQGVKKPFPDVIKAATTIHGVRLAVDEDDSPHSRAKEIAGEVLVMAAEHDAYVDRPHYDRLVEALDQGGVTSTNVWVPDVHHGFVFPQRPVFDKPAAERHWELLLAMFDRTLKR